MKNSIGIWIDNELQKKILCLEKNNVNNTNISGLKSIYQHLYTDPQKALNQIRTILEKSIKDFLKKDLELNEDEFYENKKNKRIEKNLNSLIELLRKSSKKEQEFSIKLLGNIGNNCIDLIQQLEKKHKKELADNIIDNSCDKSHLVRQMGNEGSHSKDINTNELREKAFIALLSFFHIHNILFDENPKCKYFNNFIYDELTVIYETKDDVEEWEKIRFNKLKFNYNLYEVEGQLKNNKQLILDDVIENLKDSTSSSKNIYFINFDESTDEIAFKRFKKLYKNLHDETDEKKYFLINDENQKDKNQYELIDIIPLRLLPKDENKPYKWDMCYINLSIEFDDFGVDLILFLNFNQEKFNSIQEKYNLEITNLSTPSLS